MGAGGDAVAGARGVAGGDHAYAGDAGGAVEGGIPVQVGLGLMFDVNCASRAVIRCKRASSPQHYLSGAGSGARGRGEWCEQLECWQALAVTKHWAVSENSHEEIVGAWI